MGSDTWNDAPAGEPPIFSHPDLPQLTTMTATDGDGWKPVDAPAGDGWQADGAVGEDGWNGGISAQNTSKHADGFDTPRDGGCRKCVLLRLLALVVAY